MLNNKRMKIYLSEKTNNISKEKPGTITDINKNGIKVIEFTRFLKNNTRYFEDRNLDNNDKTDVEFVKNKYLQDYLADRRNFLENKLKYSSWGSE